MDPVLVFLLPVLYAFPLSLFFMMLTFASICLISSYLFIVVLYQPDLLFANFVSLISQHISLLEVIILALKILIGGILIALLCIYFGARVENKFTDISRAISSATSSQLFAFMALNVGLSFLGYL
jgi:phospholipid/cholesterol/gamma-HCH transport system permease protein